ncbi:T9SS C-terminal target domain-containing protein [Sphingobacteriales bacterium UPWRP_1]|nr:hypothetical protein BVG80_11335 [Sphingobacteriales bacterium TSM_CSM]PSJ76372.1 T9SS C-terminal target domain-containing protein [Sphingobacteriales bacterium UPWRP_1]
MHNHLIFRVLIISAWLIAAIQPAVAQRWALNDTVYLTGNNIAFIDVLNNDAGTDLTILDVEITEYPSRGFVERSFACNCLVYTPNNDFGTAVFEDSFFYTLSSPPDNTEGSSPALINLAQVFVYFMADECNDCVWPGDSNSDGISNAWDLLPLGMAYGAYGSPRDSVSNAWAGHNATDWPGSFGTALNYKYADCNGDGFINSNDVAAIEQNYGMTHEVTAIPDMPYSGSDVVISLEILNESVEIGDTVVANVLINGGDGIANVYGLAFSVNYNVVPDSGTVNVNFPLSFLNDGYNTISVQRQAGNNIEAAITRTDNVIASGSGLLGVVSFVMEDVLAGKTEEENLVLQFTNITATNPDGTKLSVLPQGDEVDIVLSDDAPAPAPDNMVRVFPVPANNSLTVQTGNSGASRLQLLNPAGQIMCNQTLHEQQNTATLDTQMLPNGMYLLKLFTTTGVITQKVPVMHR